jgi:DNA-binding transcriptional LysR family regulator
MNCVQRSELLLGFCCSKELNNMHLRKFDLNLLVVFDVIMKERSIVGASERLSLSQSAVSHSLGRMRKLVGDELFVRDTEGMRPTARALELAVPVQQALARIEAALGSEEFVAERAARTFVIAASDYSCTLIVPRLIGRMAKIAPDIDLYILPANRLDVIRQLDDGRIDLAIAWFAAVPERFGRAKLVDENDVFLVRKGHPLTTGEPTVAGVLGYPHVVVDYMGNAERLTDGFFLERGALRRVTIDRSVIEATRRFGEHGRIAVKVPAFGSVPPIIARTDMIACVPRRLAAELSAIHGLVPLEPPYDTPPVTVEVVWHQRMQPDPGVTWLRQEVESVAADLR